MTAKKNTSRPLANAPLDIQSLMAKEAEAIRSKIASIGGGDRIQSSKKGTIVLPDGSEGDSVDIVIVDFLSVNLYYDRPYDKDVIVPPACFAIGAEPSLLTPSTNSPAKVSETCAACPMNQFGSNVNGKGKACKNTRLLAVCPDDATSDNAPIWTLSIPPTSIKVFDAYVASLAVKHKTVPLGVVTRLSQNPASDFVSFCFNVVRPLSPEELPLFFAQRDVAATRLKSEPDVSGYEPPKLTRGRGR